MSIRRIGLGTVQFGLDYGVTNISGRTTPDQVDAICCAAATAGIDTLDTAHLYGASEAVIGQSAATAPFRIITKTPKFADAALEQAAADQLRTSFMASLDRLNRDSVDALLIHDADDLLGRHGDALWQAMERVRNEGSVRKIGVSIYDGKQIDVALDRYPIEIVQLPRNPIDRRLDEGGQIDRLVGAGVEIHARSLFLQGLLLQPPHAIPTRFGPLRDAVAELRDWSSANGLGVLQGVLALALADCRIARNIVGVTSLGELQDIVSAVESGQGSRPTIDFAGSVVLEPRYLDPSRWNELGTGPSRT